jgi:REP element-mobilizing transposase RayT
MSVKFGKYSEPGLYFITLTCCQWLPLFENANAYEVVYNWFDHLKQKGHHICGYVIMPNHLHLMAAFTGDGIRVDKLVSNGKRFMAYDIVKKLEQQKQNQFLDLLQNAVSPSDRKRGKLHQVFEPSFDAKPCHNDHFIRQKLDYMHKNPITGKWILAPSAVDYVHSSAHYYFTGIQGHYAVTNVEMIKDMLL